MSEQARPWWASDDHHDRVEDVDPIEAFRAARRHPGTGHPPGGDPGAEPGTEPGGDPDHHAPHWCRTCPLCTLARLLEDTRPELMEHLTEAAHHLAAAARSLLEQPPGGAGFHRQRPTGADDEVQHIRLDDDPGPTTGPDPR